ncbi:ferredoxin--NADP reductase, root isozyme, chloroplastic-like isoform X2 [Humulus lupulus]|uniref:ferredoxin--NADP reductase, root isozyme, chloroplastic-like isoform X2 n=1 Tax=Humulus lupulus TaxID=3486 RepID=UPI002B4019A1|nr:ferredoxin--NADP reductase, root isozyme, chloroplastic-like isoform X2 [Humulus lupulus]
MALILPQVAATTFLVSDSSLKLRQSLFIKTRNVNSFHKAVPSVFANFEPLNQEFDCRRNVSPSCLENAGPAPKNLYTVNSPLTATIRNKIPISGDSPRKRQAYHIVLDHKGKLPLREGQNVGVMLPAKTSVLPDNAKEPRYFPCASSRYGDTFDGTTISLCVRPVPETISEFLCNSKEGDEIQLVGPTGEKLILGDDDDKATHIFVATGAGVAPFRAHLRRFFREYIPKFTFNGFAWLFHGVYNVESLDAYYREFQKYQVDYPKNFQYNIALSERISSNYWRKTYVQNIFEEHAESVFEKLVDEGAYIYFSGRKEMVTPIQNALMKVAEKKCKNWEKELAKLKNNNQWRDEVY